MSEDSTSNEQWLTAGDSEEKLRALGFSDSIIAQAAMSQAIYETVLSAAPPKMTLYWALDALSSVQCLFINLALRDKSPTYRQMWWENYCSEISQRAVSNLDIKVEKPQ